MVCNELNLTIIFSFIYQIWYIKRLYSLEGETTLSTVSGPVLFFCYIASFTKAFLINLKFKLIPLTVGVKSDQKNDNKRNLQTF